MKDNRNQTLLNIGAANGSTFTSTSVSSGTGKRDIDTRRSVEITFLRRAADAGKNVYEILGFVDSD